MARNFCSSGCTPRGSCKKTTLGSVRRFLQGVYVGIELGDLRGVSLENAHLLRVLFSFFLSPPLIFFSLPFEKKASKTTKKKTRIFYSSRTPKILGKEGKNAQKDKEILEKTKRKEIQKNKEKKIRVPLRISLWAIKPRFATV